MSGLKRIVGEYVYSYLYDVLRDADSIGLGTGSTIKYFIDRLVGSGILADKEIYVSSLDTLLYLEKHGYKTYTPHISGVIDVYIDGFDEASNRLDLVKGRGAALLWEKQLALRSKLRIYIGDYTKLNNRDYLYLKPVPIEVSPPTLPYVVNRLREEGVRFRIRMGRGKDGPVITDSGGVVIDLYLGRIEDAGERDRWIKRINGVVETGLFPHKLVDIVLISYPNGVVRVYEA